MALFITSLNSGSNGNCYYIGNSEEAVLIDAGISCRETEKRMQRLGLSMNKVKAIFISHEHSDHISGAAAFVKENPSIIIIAHQKEAEHIALYGRDEQAAWAGIIKQRSEDVKQSAAAMSGEQQRKEQLRLANELEERGHCRFVYHYGSGNRAFDAVDLSDYLVWAKDNKTADVVCRGGKKCINATYDSWRFQIREGTDQKKLQRAIVHLLNLCGVPRSKPDLFCH